ncbi:FkbM family methyltransferase, partial [Sediminispirochaeta bajacaliforniensis]|uniref:FkbM family methyltransferase n=1 Tax=Sediminispirochaeta bajacaliforniensis TaxID=148 RepID=UPI000368B9DD
QKIDGFDQKIDGFDQKIDGFGQKIDYLKHNAVAKKDIVNINRKLDSVRKRSWIYEVFADNLFWSGSQNITSFKVPSQESFIQQFGIDEKKERNIVNFLDMEVEITDTVSFVTVFKEIFLFEDYCINFTRSNPIILDCGAHLGFATLYFKKDYPESRIVCFEPDPNNYEVLERNIKKNNLKNVDIVKKAVGSKNDTVKFYRAIDMSMGGSITDRLERKNLKVEHFDVQMVDIKEYLENKIDFLKLDIEGNEDDVIIDCGSLLRNIQYLFIEFHTGEDLPISRLGKILSVLDNNGFNYIIDRSHPSERRKPFLRIENNYSHVVYAKNNEWSL